MDEAARKTAFRMIPYGLYVLMAEGDDGVLAAATVTWLTQASFAPPLLALGVKNDSRAYGIIKERKLFGLSILGKGQNDLAYAFFKPQEREGDTVGGKPFVRTPQGAPVLQGTAAWVECELREVVEIGDHALFVVEVTEAHVEEQPEGRPDDAALWLRDLGEKLFYGG